MILNAYSILYLFSTIIIGGLSLLLVGTSLRAYLSLRKRDNIPEHLQERGSLLLHIAHVILLAEALTLPLFYLTLQSFVPYIQGAMCIFGVTQAQGTLSGIVQVLKVFLFFLIGWWLLLDRLDNKTEHAPLSRKKTLFLFLVSTFIVLDSALQIYYIMGFNVEVDVACCTTVFDLGQRKTSIISSSLLGESYKSGLITLYYAGNLFLILLLWLLYRKRPGTRGVAVLLLCTTLLSVVNAVVTVTAYFEIIAPAVMNIPEHHCIYCMWQYSPLSVLFTFLFLMGTFTPPWALLLYITGRHRETNQHLPYFIKRLTLSGIVFIATALALQSLSM